MRKWIEVVPPKTLHDNFGMYHGEWMPQMDRCWNSDDGVYQVTSRLLITEIGKVEHAVITIIKKDENRFSFNGERDVPWNEKQAIKNELFGVDRIAIEVFPEEKRLVDVMDCYHLWILPKYFEMPFGIHPKDKKCKAVNRGVNMNLVVQNSMEVYKEDKE